MAAILESDLQALAQESQAWRKRGKALAKKATARWKIQHIRRRRPHPSYSLPSSLRLLLLALGALAMALGLGSCAPWLFPKVSQHRDRPIGVWEQPWPNLAQLQPKLAAKRPTLDEL